MMRRDDKRPDDIPVAVFEALKTHVFERGEVGHFMTAVLENDFTTAVCRADAEHYPALRAIAQFVYCELPRSSWGSHAKVTMWLRGIKPGEYEWDSGASRRACPGCGRPALDGKVTCGDTACGSSTGVDR